MINFMICHFLIYYGHTFDVNAKNWTQIQRMLKSHKRKFNIVNIGIRTYVYIYIKDM